ncbi:reverse transcriptase domain-containing protein [Tanacetum coccineum]
MADNRTMAQLLEAPTEGYEDAIVVPEITANNFEIKHGLLNLVQNKQFFGHDKEDPHAHIRYFNKITSTMKFPNVPSTSVKLMLFPFSLEGAARIWLEKEPPRSILTWDDLFVNLEARPLFPKSKFGVSSTPAVSSDVAEAEDMATDENSYSDNIKNKCHSRRSYYKPRECQFSDLKMVLKPSFGPRTFFFPANFVVVDYVADPRVPLILGRPFLRTARALIDVHGEQMTLRYDDQSVTFKVGDTKTFSYNIIESVNRVDVIDIACEEYVQEVLEISESGNPTSTSDLMIDSRSPSFTPFGGSNFLMEEIDAFLEHDDSIPPGVDGIYDSEGDTVYLEELLSVINSDPNLPPSPVCEINVPEKIKSSCEDPPDLELKDLPSHLEYAFLEGDDKLPVIIAKNLKDEDKTALIKVS